MTKDVETYNPIRSGPTTVGLFIETAPNKVDPFLTYRNCKWSLSDKPQYIESLDRTFPSLYQAYMEMEDVTEWEFAKKYFGSWEQWEQLTGKDAILEYVNRWRRELELKLRARALKAIQETAIGEGKNSYEANKLLLSANWKPKLENEKGRRGRPSKEEIKAKAKELAENEAKLSNDLERLQGTLLEPINDQRPN